MKTVTIGELATVLGIQKRAAETRASRQGWVYETIVVRGGRQRLYPVADLPLDVRDAVLRSMLRSDSRALPAIVEPAPVPAPIEQAESELKDWQRTIMLARLSIVREVERLERTGGKMAAIQALVTAESKGELDPAIARAASLANAKKGETRGLSASTIRRWMDQYAASGRRPIVLAPAPSAHEKPLPPDWLADFLDFWAIPSKPSIARTLTEVRRKQPDLAHRLPPLRTIQHAIKKLPALERNRGRMGPRALRQLKAFVRRDVSELWPTAVYVTDGHTHHAFVAHPVTGKPFRPEITATIDVFTRRATGWSVALAEATWGTMDALRHAFTTSGVPDIWYVDRGTGLNNEVLDDPLTGLLARFDVQKENSLPYRSQARGVIERFHQMWIEAARLSPHYAGQDMDQEVRKSRDLAIRDEIAESGHASSLQSWHTFIEWCSEEIAAYNAKPHSFLPKIREADGKLRHLSPDEVWNGCLGEGWQPDLVQDFEVDSLFRPQIRRQTRRGEIQLFTNRYFAIELEEFHELDVLVSYDIHDANKVWVFTTDQRLICEARFHGNSVSYFPASRIEQAHENRVNNQKKRALKGVARAEENRGLPIFETVALPPRPPLALAPVEATEPPIAVEPEPIAPAGPAEVEATPRFTNDYDLVAWAMANPTRLTARDAAYLVPRIRDHSVFRLRLEVSGIDPNAALSLARRISSQEASA